MDLWKPKTFWERFHWNKKNHNHKFKPIEGFRAHQALQIPKVQKRPVPEIANLHSAWIGTTHLPVTMSRENPSTRYSQILLLAIRIPMPMINPHPWRISKRVLPSHLRGSFKGLSQSPASIYLPAARKIFWTRNLLNRQIEAFRTRRLTLLQKTTIHF